MTCSSLEKTISLALSSMCVWVKAAWAFCCPMDHVYWYCPCLAHDLGVMLMRFNGYNAGQYSEIYSHKITSWSSLVLILTLKHKALLLGPCSYFSPSFSNYPLILQITPDFLDTFSPQTLVTGRSTNHYQRRLYPLFIPTVVVKNTINTF